MNVFVEVTKLAPQPGAYFQRMVVVVNMTHVAEVSEVSRETRRDICGEAGAAITMVDGRAFFVADDAQALFAALEVVKPRDEPGPDGQPTLPHGGHRRGKLE
jgi:hypothetical protein